MTLPDIVYQSIFEKNDRLCSEIEATALDYKTIETNLIYKLNSIRALMKEINDLRNFIRQCEGVDPENYPDFDLNYLNPKIELIDRKS